MAMLAAFALALPTLAAPDEARAVLAFDTADAGTAFDLVNLDRRALPGWRF